MIEELKNQLKDLISDKEEQDNYKIASIPERLRKNKKIALLVEDKVEDLEFFYPYYRFSEAGYDVDVISIKGGSFEGKNGLGLKDSKSIDEVISADYELLYIPGGKAPEKLKDNEKVLNFVREFANKGKIIATICHGAWLLIAANLVRSKKIAAWPEIRDEVEKAGGIFADEALQKDGQFITARKPGDLHRHLNGIFDSLNK